MAHKFKIGDVVKYTSNSWGNAPQNPLWNGKHGKIKGKVYDIDPKYTRDTKVRWDNGHTNSYYEDDLELISSSIISMLSDDLFEVE